MISKRLLTARSPFRRLKIAIEPSDLSLDIKVKIMPAFEVHF